MDATPLNEALAEDTAAPAEDAAALAVDATPLNEALAADTAAPAEDAAALADSLAADIKSLAYENQLCVEPSSVAKGLSWDTLSF